VELEKMAGKHHMNIRHFSYDIIAWRSTPLLHCYIMDSNNDNMTTTTTTTNTTPKIIDLINEPSETPKISLEFFPPRSPEGVEVS
jgi:hypothetical protein